MENRSTTKHSRNDKYAIYRENFLCNNERETTKYCNQNVRDGKSRGKLKSPKKDCRLELT